MSVVIKEIETKGVMTNAFLHKKTDFTNSATAAHSKNAENTHEDSDLSWVFYNVII